jgi:cytidylate kinase
MKVLLSGLLGAGCTEVAETLAKQEKAKVVNSVEAIKDLISERGQSYQLFDMESRSGEFDLDALLRNKALEYIDDFDNLIVEGRLALLVLDHPFDLKAFLTATLDERIAHVASRRKIGKEQARKVVQHSDKEREHVVEKLFDYPLDLCRFDVVLNTSTYGFERAAKSLGEFLRKPRL